MTKLEKMERDIATLSLDESERLREWFALHEADAFDRRIARDAASVRLDPPANAALAEHRTNRTRLL